MYVFISISISLVLEHTNLWSPEMIC